MVSRALVLQKTARNYWKEVLTGVLVILFIPIIISSAFVSTKSIPAVKTEDIEKYITVSNEIAEEKCMVDWRDLVSIDAVRFKQDFSRVTKGSIRDLAERFVITKKTTVTDEEGNEKTVITYECKALSQVLDEMGFTEEQKKEVELFKTVGLPALIGDGSLGGGISANDIPKDLINLFMDAGKAVNLPSGFLAAIAKHESSFNPKTQSNGDGGSAYGLMQIWQPNWEGWYARSDFKIFLIANGFKSNSATHAWNMYLNSPKMQIFVGGWIINSYINASLYNHGVISSNPGFNTANMSKIDWKDLKPHSKSYDFVGKGLAIYNGGGALGWATDIYGTGMIATYVQKVLKSTLDYNAGGSIVEIAKKYLGVPYLWGGYDPSQGGMDCSGFMQYIHKQIGVDITRTTYTQVVWNGFQNVSLNDLQAGDLLYYSYNGSSVEHVGLYVGNGQFIHASGDEQDVTVAIAKSRGHQIMISDYNGYWKSVTHSIKRLKK